MNIDSIYHDLIQKSKLFKNQHVQYEAGSIKLIVTCIPDIVDRVEWFCDGMHISASYAKVLIERSLDK